MTTELGSEFNQSTLVAEIFRSLGRRFLAVIAGFLLAHTTLSPEQLAQWSNVTLELWVAACFFFASQILSILKIMRERKFKKFMACILELQNSDQSGK